MVPWRLRLGNSIRGSLQNDVRILWHMLFYFIFDLLNLIPPDPRAHYFIWCDFGLVITYEYLFGYRRLPSLIRLCLRLQPNTFIRCSIYVPYRIWILKLFSPYCTVPSIQLSVCITKFTLCYNVFFCFLLNVMILKKIYHFFI